MSLLATQQDFEAGGLYDNYQRYPFFAKRARLIKQRWGPSTVLVVGCGWGYLVDELRKVGIDAWGVDLSDYALRKAHAELPDVFPYIHKADGRVPQQLQRVGPGIWDLVVTEDVLTVSSNEQEVDRFITAARSVARDHAVHILTCWYDFHSDDKKNRRDSRVMWKTPDEWAALVQPDPIIDNFQEVITRGPAL